jgi:hypothetical protein
MRHQDKIRLQRRRRRKYFWLFFAAAVSALLLGEQIVVLYALATFVMCGLFIVRAFSNLKATDPVMQAVTIQRRLGRHEYKIQGLSRGARAA